MKASQYNHFFPVAGGEVFLAYNSFTGSLAEIEKEHYPRVRDLLDDPASAQTDQDHEFLQCLQDGGFMVADAIDQRAMLRTTAKNSRLEGAVLTLTIAPTFACNFACDYCFQHESAAMMNHEVQDALIRFAERQLVRSEGLRICWFGGEPTLCFPMIERLQTRLLELAARRRAQIVPGTIITNGYLLDAAMARRLKELAIPIAQVTIDGPEAIHDRRRKLRNGKGTFRRIIENLGEAAEILSINVRINVDRGNIESAYEVMELLQREGILPKVKVHFAQVTSGGDTCANIRDRCYTDLEFSNIQAALYRRLLELGIDRVEYPQALGGGGFCGALADSYYSIAPNGLIFRCWEELSTDPANSVGDIFSTPPTDTQRANLQSYRSFDPFKFSECFECNVLPLCGGGCPLRAKEKTDKVRGECVPWRFNLAEMIELSYEAQTRRTEA